MSQHSHYHVFSLPPSLLETLLPRSILGQDQHHASDARPTSPAPSTDGIPPTSAARACNICLGAAFSDVDAQRAHFRSDWHRYNVKMRIAGSNSVSEAQFSQLVDALEDSLSGSASSSNEESDDDAVDTLVDKTRKLNTIHGNGNASDDDDPSKAGPNTPVVWFHSPPSTQIGVYKAIFPPHLAPLSTASSGQLFLDELKAMQIGRGSNELGRKWALFMVAGGHFAGAVVRVARPDDEHDDDGAMKKGKQKKPKPDNEILLHKTFHRYTTRRKQGGSQSTNDNSKSKAVSAGAMLRRYGEQALRDDIRNLLADWAEELDDCERIFIRASVSNRKIFLDHEDSPIRKGDERLRTFPFPTRRPTQSELSRCLLELTYVKVSHLSEETLRAQDAEYLSDIAKLKARATVPYNKTSVTSKKADGKPKLTPEELAREQAELDLKDKWERACEMVMKGRMDALRAFLSKENPLGIGGINARRPGGMEDGDEGETLLIYAARKGQADVVRWLLEDARADPTISVSRAAAGASGADGADVADEDDEEIARPVASGSRRAAYDFARTRQVRDVFRRCAADHPDWWDWLGAAEGGARVPSVLSHEMEESREEKKKVRRKGLKEKVKERESKEQVRVTDDKGHECDLEEARRAQSMAMQKKDTASDGPRKLGGSNTASEGVMGLTPEMRARVERERRARAAEARLRKS